MLVYDPSCFLSGNLVLEFRGKENLGFYIILLVCYCYSMLFFFLKA